jgi:radical SAM superfamily enzyme YgiQ (UPF0313 family)
MKLVLVNIYPEDTLAEYMLSSYVLKAYLDSYGNDIETEVLDFPVGSGAEEISGRIIKENPDLVGYSCYVWNIEKVKNVVGKLKGRYRQLLGGPEISLSSVSPESGTDHFIIGEGERQLLELVNSLQGNSRLLISQSTYGAGNGKGSRQAGNVANLDEIPSPYLKGVMPEHLYKRRMALLETQRGCKYRCKFCVYHKNLPSIRYYSLERVKQELIYLIKEKGVYALRIFDASFTSDLPRAKTIIKYLIELKKEVRLPWIYWEWRWEDADEEFIQLLGKLKYKERISNSNSLVPLDRPQHYTEMLEGYTAINSVGVESFNAQSMKAVGRAPVDIKKFDRFMGWVKQHNAALKLDFIIDLPYETYQSYWRGVEGFLPYLENTDHILNVHLLEILPGSKLEEEAQKYRLLYGKDAPHLVKETGAFVRNDLTFSSKLTALLFRMINSPLRQECLRYFKFRKQRERNLTLEGLLKGLYHDRIKRDFPGIKLVTAEMVDEDYWENRIFEDVPSEWLKEVLR